MKIAISATEGSLDAQVDQRFGRAAWFLLIETKTGELLEAIDNTTGKAAAHGAGISAAALVADKGVQAVLTGRVGPKAEPILQKAKVQIVNDISGSVLDAVTGFGQGKQAVPTETTPQDNTSQNCNNDGCGGGGGGGRGMGQGKGQGRGMGQGRGQCRR